jgi:hypothetical protein
VRTVSRIDAPVERFQEGVELLGGAGELDRVGLVGYVDDAPAEDVRGALDFLAVLAAARTLTSMSSRSMCLPSDKVHDLHHVHELVQLLGDLLDDLVGARS